MSTNTDRSDAQDVRADISERKAKSFKSNVAVALAIVSLGCIGGIYLVNQDSQSQADKNACALSTLLQIQKERAQQLAADNFRVQVRDLAELQRQVEPDLMECSDIIDYSNIEQVNIGR